VKKLITLLLALATIFSLCACGKENGSSAADTQTTESAITPQSTKGTKNDPYKLGDEINLTSCNMGEDQKFAIKLKIKALTDEETTQAENLRKNKLDSTKQYLGLELTLESEDGNYSNSIQSGTTSGGFPLIRAYTSSMSETYFVYFSHEKADNIYDFYADVDYDLYMLFSDEGDYSMISVEYRTGAYKTDTIWIAL
jgi:predicted small lipoprotein YifL